MQNYKLISKEEADVLAACGVQDLEYEFSGVTVNGQNIYWAPFTAKWKVLGSVPSEMDWVLGWRVKLDG